jgi:hypothetical protein
MRSVLREIAEALIDFGYGDAQSVIFATELRSIDEDLAEITGEMIAVESEMAALDENVRRRLGFMRFGLGELRIDRVALQAEAAQETEWKIEDLKRRINALRAYREREMIKLGDRGVQLAARRASLDERTANIFVALANFVDLRWAELEELTPIVPLLELLQRARAELARAARE